MMKAWTLCEVMEQPIPEADNPHDPLAVRVEIQGRQVGYLSRAEARKYRAVLEDYPVPIRALIVGGWDHTYLAGRRMKEPRDRSASDCR